MTVSIRRCPPAFAFAFVSALLAVGPGGAQWELASALPGYAASGAIYNPAVAISDDDSVAIAWWRQPDYSVWTASRQGAAGSWTVENFSPGTIGSPPSIAMSGDGDLAVVWSGFGDVFARYRPAGGAWESVARLEMRPTGYVKGRVQVSMNNAGDVLVGWVVVNAGVTAYEVHTVLRLKAGPWPATGGFEIAGGPATVSGELAVALDDAGRAAAAWTANYATFDDDPNHNASVLRAAQRPTGGPWGAAFDLSPRGPIEGTVACVNGHPAVPTASGPSFATDPETGELTLIHVFDPTSWEWDDPGDPGVGCFETLDDSVARLGSGTVAVLPSTATAHGSRVSPYHSMGASSGPPSISLRASRVAVAWREEAADLSGDPPILMFGVAPFGSAVAVSTGDLSTSFGVAMGGDGRGFVVSNFDPVLPVTATADTLGWSALVGSSGDGPVTLAIDNFWDPAVAANCRGYALSAIIGVDHMLYIAEYPSAAPPCGLLFADGFEINGTGNWSAVAP